MPGVAQTALRMTHDTDPRKDIQDQIAPYLADIQILASQIMVGIYMRPEKTAGGIILTRQTRDEDKFQGIVGLVLKVGPTAFTEDDTHKWNGITPSVGDWVIFNVGDGWAFNLGERRCRMIEDVHVKAIIERPDMVL